MFDCSFNFVYQDVVKTQAYSRAAHHHDTLITSAEI